MTEHQATMMLDYLERILFVLAEIRDKPAVHVAPMQFGEHSQPVQTPQFVPPKWTTGDPCAPPYTITCGVTK